MDRAEMINSLAEAMGIKSAVKEDTEFTKKYNTNTGTIYCNNAKELEQSEEALYSKVSVFPVKRLAM